MRQTEVRTYVRVYMGSNLQGMWGLSVECCGAFELVCFLRACETCNIHCTMMVSVLHKVIVVLLQSPQLHTRKFVIHHSL